MQQLLQKLKQFQRKLQIASAEAVTALVKLQIAPAEAEIAFVETASTEAATAPAHSAVTPTVVLEIEGSHKDYLIIFSQIMNLMPNIFLPSKRYYSNGII